MRRWAALILGAAGGLACGQLGAVWVREALRMRADPSIAIAVGLDPTTVLVAAISLVLAMIAGLLGGLLAGQGYGRLGAWLLIAGGVVPGLVDPRAFVVTSVLCLAGVLAMGMECAAAARAPQRRGVRPRAPSLLSRQSHVSVG